MIRFEPESKSTRHYQMAPDDPDSIGPGWITTIVEDRSGRLWFGHGNKGEGISRYDRAADKFVRHDYDAGHVILEDSERIHGAAVKWC